MHCNTHRHMHLSTNHVVCGTYRIVGDRRRRVEDAVAAGDGRPYGVVVEQVGAAQLQPLRRAGERPQVRVLRVICIYLFIFIEGDKGEIVNLQLAI